MAQFVGADGVLQVERIPDDFGTKTADLTQWNGWMGWDCYLGTDCSGSVYSSWSQVSNVQFDSTGNENPNYSGILPVGEYVYAGLTKPSEMCKATARKNDEVYARCCHGDAVVYEGHTPDASGPSWYETADGSIVPDASYVLFTILCAAFGSSPNMTAPSNNTMCAESEKHLRECLRKRRNIAIRQALQTAR